MRRASITVPSPQATSDVLISKSLMVNLGMELIIPMANSGSPMVARRQTFFNFKLTHYRQRRTGASNTARTSARTDGSGTISSYAPLSTAAPRMRACPARSIVISAGTRPFFLIGVTLLTMNDREKARQHFRASSDLKVILYVEDHMSRALIAQLDRDPQWPPWIAAR
jgi:hypothetical protein